MWSPPMVLWLPHAPMVNTIITEYAHHAIVPALSVLDHLLINAQAATQDSSWSTEHRPAPMFVEQINTRMPPVNANLAVLIVKNAQMISTALPVLHHLSSTPEHAYHHALLVCSINKESALIVLQDATHAPHQHHALELAQMDISRIQLVCNA